MSDLYKKLILWSVIGVVIVVALAMLGYGVYALFLAVFGGSGGAFKLYQSIERKEFEANDNTIKKHESKAREIDKKIDKVRKSLEEIENETPPKEKDLKGSIMKDAEEISKWVSMVAILLFPSSTIAQTVYTAKDEAVIKTALKKCRILKKKHSILILGSAKAESKCSRDKGLLLNRVTACQQKKAALLGRKCYCVIPWVITAVSLASFIGAIIIIRRSSS